MAFVAGGMEPVAVIALQGCWEGGEGIVERLTARNHTDLAFWGTGMKLGTMCEDGISHCSDLSMIMD